MPAYEQSAINGMKPPVSAFHDRHGAARTSSLSQPCVTAARQSGKPRTAAQSLVGAERDSLLRDIALFRG
jgi:hypothetical protein